jgi:dTDP-glucose 4,6-dehydratase
MLASSSEVYGYPLVHPQHEDYRGNVNQVGVRGVYDEAKRYAEAITIAYHRHHGLETRIVRIFNSYGPRTRPDDGRMIPNFISQALSERPLTLYGDGSQTRSIQYVDDLIEGTLRLMGSSERRPVNLGNPQELSVREIAALIIELSGSGSGMVFEPLPEDDPGRRCPDISRAREVLGWEPRVPARGAPEDPELVCGALAREALRGPIPRRSPPPETPRSSRRTNALEYAAARARVGTIFRAGRRE